MARPIIEVDETVQVLGFGPSVEEATEDATRAAIDVVARGARMDPEEAYMLLSIIGELRIGTSPRPVMAARLIIPLATLDGRRLDAPLVRTASDHTWTPREAPPAGFRRLPRGVEQRPARRAGLRRARGLLARQRRDGTRKAFRAPTIAAVDLDPRRHLGERAGRP